MQELYVDFNTMQQFMDNEHVIIGQMNHQSDAPLRLCEGEHVKVYDEEFSVEAIVHQEGNFWIGVIDWATRKAHVSAVNA